MKKKLIIITTIFFISMVFLSSSAHASSAENGDYPEDYQFKLYVARGELSLADNYYDTAIKNLKDAITIKSNSAYAHDLYEKAIVLKKLGVISEAAESG